MSMTAVNIVTKSKQENDDDSEDVPIELQIPTEVLDAIDDLIEKAVKHNVGKTDIGRIMSDRRREYEYQLEVARLPEENEKVKLFRKGLESFYKNLEIQPKDLTQFLWDYEFEYSNYHIEIPVAAYQLYLSSETLSEENIFNWAKIRMRPYDAYYEIPRKKTSWRTSKNMNIQRFRVYFDKLCDARIKRFFLEKDWIRFLSNQKKYEYMELPWLKIIYLVEKFYC